MKKRIIVWDLGATKCAAAVVEYDTNQGKLACVSQTKKLIHECESIFDLSLALELQLQVSFSSADAICIGAAGQFDGYTLHLSNGYPYPMRFAALAERNHWPAYAVIHDYSPIVCATFTDYMEQADNVARLNNKAIHIYGRRVALGLGTGLGLKDGILFPDGNFWLGTNEVGHIGVVIPPQSDAYFSKMNHQFFEFLKDTMQLSGHQTITFEGILSGKGSALLHAFMTGKPCQSPEEVGLQLKQGLAPKTLEAMSFYLGLFIGTIQLCFMPDGGIWVTGGVVLNHPELLTEPAFQLGIQSSPAYLKQREQFPLGILQGNNHAFWGGAYYAAKRLLR